MFRDPELSVAALVIFACIFATLEHSVHLYIFSNPTGILLECKLVLDISINSAVSVCLVELYACHSVNIEMLRGLTFLVSELKAVLAFTEWDTDIVLFTW